MSSDWEGVDPATLPRSIDEARQLGIGRYFTGKPCKRGHVAMRLTSCNHCIECAKAHSAKWVESNRGKAAARCKRWRERHPEQVSAAKLEWREGNRDRHRALALAWRNENLGRARANTRKYQATLSMAMPPWADADAIVAIYDEAVRLERETGIDHHVDHIIPLNGKTVSGLHVAWNLEPKPRAVNRAKGGKFNDDGSPYVPKASAA